MADDLLAVKVQVEGLHALGRALKAEEDGKQLRREVTRNMRDALQPAVADARSGIMSMPATGTASPGLRSEIAKKIRPEVRLSGRSTGARVRAKKIRTRNFANAPKRTQQAKGWRHRVFGTDEWVTQQGKVDWFDRAMDGKRDLYRAACQEAMEAMAERIARRGRG